MIDYGDEDKFLLCNYCSHFTISRFDDGDAKSSKSKLVVMALFVQMDEMSLSHASVPSHTYCSSKDAVLVVCLITLTHCGFDHKLKSLFFIVVCD